MTVPTRTIWNTTQEVVRNTLYTNQRFGSQFRGVTTDATQTEIFINGEADQRLEPPPNSIVLINWEGMGMKRLPTGDTAHYIGRGWISARRIESTFVIAGTNADPGAADGNPAGQAIKGTESHCVFALDATNLWFTLKVTGAAATEIDWNVWFDARCMSYPPERFLVDP